MANIKDFIKKIGNSAVSLEEQQQALAQVEQTIIEAKQKRTEAVGKNADMVIQALKTIEAKLEAKLTELNNTPAKQGIQGPVGKDGKDGKDGKNGRDGLNGKDGTDGKDGVDGKDGISVVDAKIDFDGSLVVYLSNGNEIDCGQILQPEVAKNIIISSGGSGTSQVVTDTLVSLQNQINTLTGIDGVLGDMAQQNANAVAITGGTINGTTVGATTPATGKFSTLESTGTGSFGTTSAQYIQAVGNATEPQILAVGSGTNIPLVLQPKGTGALQAQATTSTTAGGNARGANAVDWQTSRNSAGQVASGAQSIISGGLQNIASGGQSVVSGGQNNTASGTNSYVGGGYLNTGSGLYSGVITGYSNTAAGYYNFIGGGFTNNGTSGSAVTTQAAATNGVTSGSTAVTLSGSNASIKVGQLITGTGIQAFPNTYVAAISGTSLTLSQNATANGSPTLSFFTPHGVVVGGGNNQATGSYSFIGGGGDAGNVGARNLAAADWSVVVGGQQNQISANANTGTGFHFIGGGINNVITTANAHAAICGGQGNTISASRGFIGGGSTNITSAIQASVLGGSFNTASGLNSSVLGGQYGTTRSISGQHTLAACSSPISATLGISQTALLVLARQTTDATATVLTSDANAAGTTNQVILPNNSAYFFTGEVVSGVTGGGNTKGWTIEGVIKRGANAASTALVGTPTVTSMYADVGAATWALAVTADTTNGGIRVTFTGQASTTIRTVARISTVEMTY